MFSHQRPYKFHIELTDKCNSACPMCPRTNAMDHCKPNQDKVFNLELKLSDIKKHFDDEFCSQTQEVLFSGAYGDPLAASELLEITEYLTDRGVRVTLSTNGGLRGPKWWQRLGEALKKVEGRLELHIDGLEDTNPLYRVNTQFSKIMVNAEAFIKTGACAEWVFIIFKHNEHQIEKAYSLAREMGFMNFTLIDTVRFPLGNHFQYVSPKGEARMLELPSLSSGHFSVENGNLIRHPKKKLRPQPTNKSFSLKPVNGILCKSKALNYPYISAHGQVSACCWVTGSTEEKDFFSKHHLPSSNYNLHKRQLSEIVLDEPFASFYETAWKADTLKNCRDKCGKQIRNTRTQFDIGC